MAEDKKEKQLPRFDSGSRPTSEQNRDASRARKLTWSPRRGYFVDDDGCLMRDRFGQRL